MYNNGNCKSVSSVLFLYKRPKLVRELKNEGFGHPEHL